LKNEKTISVVIVSWNRPQSLRSLLFSMRYQHYRRFEVIVVARENPADIYPELANVENIKFVPVHEQNISAARNAGIAVSAGEIVAFCDDDAIPEPTWLAHLCAPFADEKIGAAGGFVRGRNGFSFQWRARTIDRLGEHTELDVDLRHPTIHYGNSQTGIKTEGTNCAFRKSALIALGGFDDNFRYYLDETDLNFRLGCAGWATAIVPLAQVQHKYAPSGTRHENRAPKDLFEIGASKAYFLNKHADAAELEPTLQAFMNVQRRRLINFMVAGLLEPRDVKTIFNTLTAGAINGRARTVAHVLKMEIEDTTIFQAFRPEPAEIIGRALVGRPRFWRANRYKAAKMAAKGVPVTCFQLSRTTLFHQASFHPDGYWIHTGGIYGKSQRTQRLFQRNSINRRVQSEIDDLSVIRPLDKTPDSSEHHAV